MYPHGKKCSEKQFVLISGFQGDLPGEKAEHYAKKPTSAAAQAHRGCGEAFAHEHINDMLHCNITKVYPRTKAIAFASHRSEVSAMIPNHNAPVWGVQTSIYTAKFIEYLLGRRPRQVPQILYEPRCGSIWMSRARDGASSWNASNLHCGTTHRRPVEGCCTVLVYRICPRLPASITLVFALLPLPCAIIPRCMRALRWGDGPAKLGYSAMLTKALLAIGSPRSAATAVLAGPNSSKVDSSCSRLVLACFDNCHIIHFHGKYLKQAGVCALSGRVYLF